MKIKSNTLLSVFFSPFLIGVTLAQAQTSEVSQSPLYLGGGNVPGNLALTISAEFPTVISMASPGNVLTNTFSGTPVYTNTFAYIGYFDPNKCYDYSYSETETNSYFYPAGKATNRTCSRKWSGNFLNWATMQTIDPFRSVLTGGYRVKDTPTETWLEKAWASDQGSDTNFPNLRIPSSGNNSTLVKGATPFSENFVGMRIRTLGNKMQFKLNGKVDTTSTAYIPSEELEDKTYDVIIRVKVCDPSSSAGGVEPNCKQYSQGWKPEGLMQQYADGIRFSIFSYLNDGDLKRDGGVLRAAQKFIGPKKLEPGQGVIDNPNKEWDLDTGVCLKNPNSDEADTTTTSFGTSISDSGVLNYLNKFGQLNTPSTFKTYDPVSELYYAAVRYFKNLGNVPEYTNVGSANAATKKTWADGFPVITDWKDPIQYACQKNVILGIGDVNTHADKNLPGPTGTKNEPTKPAAVSADTTVDAVAATNKVGDLEGISSLGTTENYGGCCNNNSALIAGLAYDSHVNDIRPDVKPDGKKDWAGKQTISTYWLDVVEYANYKNNNQYYLATKYGGFKVSKTQTYNYGDPLTESWWHTNTQTYGSNKKPDNYYVASRADQMTTGLTTAFENIAADVRSSASSVAANSTRLETNTAIFQAAFDSGNWSGELLAYRISASGLAADPTWNAATKLDAIADTSVLTTRKIFTVKPPASKASVTNSKINFVWSDIDSTQQLKLQKEKILGTTTVDATTGEKRLKYLSGERANEQTTSDQTKLFRLRGSRLGDLVNSDPQYIYKDDFGYAQWNSSYSTFRAASTYQSRPPVVVVGANDGMLHGFRADIDSNGGTELFAYVPNGVYDNLFKLTLSTYEHNYYVDGTARIADAYSTSWPTTGETNWRTIVVGTTGAGGKSVFALDITNPTSMTKDNVLWEFSPPEMGYTIFQPAIVPLPDGQFGVIVTSGYESSGTDGIIWILNPADGSIIHTITVNNSGNLGSPFASDLDGDRVADRIYVGDTKGQLWRFDLPDKNHSNWQAPSTLQDKGKPIPLFIDTVKADTISHMTTPTPDPYPYERSITAAPVAEFNVRGELMVFFGTGSFYKINDSQVPADSPIDTFYGIIDRGNQIVGRSTLVEQEILTQVSIDGKDARAVTNNVVDCASKDGWYLDLVWKQTYGGSGPVGERVISRAKIRDDRVIFPTLIPSTDPCAYGGSGFVMELGMSCGNRLDNTVFDVKSDNKFDDQDKVEINGVLVPISGIDFGIGIPRTPVVVLLPPNTDPKVPGEFKAVSGSSGDIKTIGEANPSGLGRQSWEQLR